MDLGASPLLLSKENRLGWIHLASCATGAEQHWKASSQAGEVSRQWQQPLGPYVSLKEENSKGAKLQG